MDPNQTGDNTAGATPTPAPQFIDHGDGLISTTEFSNPPSPEADQSPDGGAKPEGQEGAKASAKDGSENDDGKDKGGRLDRDSRFQQVIKNNRDLKNQLAELSEKLESLTSQKPSSDAAAKGDADGKIMGMTQDELLDLQAADPAKYHDLITQHITDQVSRSVTDQWSKAADQREQEARIAKTYESYAERNPDFNEMWDSGEIQDFMAANPGLNAISAHQMMTGEKRTKSAVEQAVKEATEKIKADLRTKGKSRVLGEGPSGQFSQPGISDQDLKDPDKFGGRYQVLAQRNAARRAGA